MGTLAGGGLAGGVFDPAGVAWAAKVNRQAAVDLVHQVGFGQVARLVDQAVDLGGDVAGEVLRGDFGWAGVGEGLDPDHVEAASAGLEVGAAAVAEQREVVICGHGEGDRQALRSTSSAFWRWLRRRSGAHLGSEHRQRGASPAISRQTKATHKWLAGKSLISILMRVQQNSSGDGQLLRAAVAQAEVVVVGRATGRIALCAEFASSY